MSVALALNAGAYVMLASDTRRTRYNEAGERIGFHDNERKAFYSDRLMMTGTGSVPLLEAVATRVTTLEEPTADVILGIIGEEQDRFARRDLPAVFLKHGLRQTSWFISARVPRADGFEMVLVSYAPGLGHSLTVSGTGTVAPLIPIDQEDEGAIAVWRTVADLLGYCRTCDPGDDIEASIAYNAGVMRSLIAACADLFETVSRACVVGVHLLDGSIRQLAFGDSDERALGGPLQCGV